MYICAIPVNFGAKNLDMILVTPELNVPPPSKMTSEEIHDLRERAQLLFNTVEFLEANGLDTSNLQPTEADRKITRAVFSDNPTADPKDIKTAPRAMMLKALLDEYDFDVVRNSQQLRSYIKLKLLELSTSNQEKTQLKALELMGKMSDVGAFTERIEINVTHRSTEELENELAKKLSSYMSDILDVESKDLTSKFDPLPDAPAVEVIDLDEELGDVVLDDERVNE